MSHTREPQMKAICPLDHRCGAFGPRVTDLAEHLREAHKATRVEEFTGKHSREWIRWVTPMVGADSLGPWSGKPLKFVKEDNDGHNR